MANRSPFYSVLFVTVIAVLTISAEDQQRRETTNTTNQSASGIISPNNNTPRETTRRTTRNPRVLFIITDDCPRCTVELDRLQKPGGDFAKLQAIGWKIGEGTDNHIQIVDQSEIPDIVQRLNVKEFPAVACVTDREIVRSFKEGCTTPLDLWTFGWLLKGENERPKTSLSETARVETTGSYRLRGNHWSIEGDPNPTKEVVLTHLRGPNHAHDVAGYGAIENWSYEELRSLHDDVHEREGRVYATYGRQQPQSANRNLDAFSGNRKALGR